MSKRRKYSYEFKLQIVQEYLEAKSGGYTILSRKYGINRSLIKDWVRLYQGNGAASLSGSPGTYSGEFKIYAVEYMHQHSLSVNSAAAHFGISAKSTLSKWERIYYEEGKEALLKDRRGRPKLMSDKKKSSSSKKDVNQNEDLLAEVQRLRMENEFLKKLIALTQEEEESGKKM